MSQLKFCRFARISHVPW